MYAEMITHRDQYLDQSKGYDLFASSPESFHQVSAMPVKHAVIKKLAKATLDHY